MVYRIFKTLSIFSLVTSLFFWSLAAHAQGLNIIRDTEIENAIKEWSSPIFEAAGMKPEQIKLILVGNDQVNAFVAGGANIFLFTGLILESKHVGELIGVIAHETGHISGGHLVKAREAMENAFYENLIATLLGIAAAAGTGEAAAAGAISLGGQNIAQRGFLAHTRIHESSADQAAIKFMESAQINPAGLVSFMEKLQDQELLPASQQVEYIRTHPLTSNRIRALKNGLDNSQYSQAALPQEWEEDYARVKAKLVGYLKPANVGVFYPNAHADIPSAYAHAIAHYRQDHKDKAIALINQLIEQESNNPYFHETKGQILFENGDIQNAIDSYRKAAQYNPQAPLIRIALGQAMLESYSKDEHILREAENHLAYALSKEPKAAHAHRLMATLQGRRGNEALAKLYLAEEALIQGRLAYAKQQAGYAKEKLPKNSRAWLRANDILTIAENVSQ